MPSPFEEATIAQAVLKEVLHKQFRIDELV
jgi:hypothetical protein